MKKKWLPLFMLLCVCAGSVGGCKKGNDGPVSKLTDADGNEIVLKVGDKTYTANELYNDLANSEDGAKEIYEKILKMVVESTIEVDSNMEASWDLLLESFEEDVASEASSSSISEDEARETLLEEEGYASIDEKKEAYLYQVRLEKLQDKYWEETKNDYYNEYVENMLPYYVKHVLVKTSYTAARGPYASTIDSSDATALYKVYKMLVEDNKFSYIMNELSEDTGSQEEANGYEMGLTTSFVTEFLHGVITFDAMLKGKTSEVTGLNSDVLNYYKSTDANNEGYNFSVINASDIVALGDTASNTSYNSSSIYTYTNEDDGEGGTTETKGDQLSSGYGASSLYTRNIIFNQTFNNPGISVIAYDLDGEVPENTTTININGEDKTVLTDENGNIVFVVRALGSSSDLWIHFLTINVSAFDENIKLFYSMDQEATIEEMVAAKKTALEAEGKTADEVTSLLETYKASLEAYKTYVDLEGGEKQSDRNTVIEEIEDIVKTYARRNASGEDEYVTNVNLEDQYLTYDMVEYYMNKGEITISDENIKNIVTKYVNAKRDYIDLTNNNEIALGWEDYYKELNIASSTDSKKIPMECSYYTAGSTSEVCKYNYSTGFEIVMKYDMTNGGTLPEDETTYTTSYHIGDDAVVLPIPTRDGYTFDGWYTTATSEDGVKVTASDINTKESSIKNKTHLYARWTPVE